MSGGRVNITLSNRDRRGLGLPPKWPTESPFLVMADRPPFSAFQRHRRSTGREISEAVTARRHEALGMRERGLSYQAIGDHFGVSRQRAHQIVAESNAAALRQLT